MADALYILFRDILQFTSYPGGDFSGNPIQDVLQFFFLPTVLIIFFIYILLGRIGLGGHTMMRTLMGVSIFIFIVINGWFASFAGSVEFYFLILLFMGIVYFVLGHFRHQGGGAPGGGGAAHFPHVKERDEFGGRYAVPRIGHAPQSAIEARFSFSTAKRLREVEDDIRATRTELKAARDSNSGHEAEVLQKQLQEFERERREIVRQRQLI